MNEKKAITTILSAYVVESSEYYSDNDHDSREGDLDVDNELPSGNYKSRNMQIREKAVETLQSICSLILQPDDEYTMNTVKYIAAEFFPRCNGHSHSHSHNKVGSRLKLHFDLVHWLLELPPTRWELISKSPMAMSRKNHQRIVAARHVVCFFSVIYRIYTSYLLE